MADAVQLASTSNRPPVLEIEGLKKHFPIKKGFCAGPPVTCSRSMASA